MCWLRGNDARRIHEPRTKSLHLFVEVLSLSRAVEREKVWLVWPLAWTAFLVFLVIGVLGWHLCTMLDDTETIVFDPHASSGDIVLFRHSKYNAIPFLGHRLVSHAAVIWRINDIPYIVDINPTLIGPYNDDSHIVVRGPYASIYPLSHALAHYPGTVLWRRIRTPLTSKQEVAFADAIETIALPALYDTDVSERDIMTYCSIASSTLIPEISVYISLFSAISQNRTSIFCTELIATLLQTIGVIPTIESYIHGPISWLYRTQTPELATLWDPERTVLSRKLAAKTYDNVTNGPLLH